MKASAPSHSLGSFHITGRGRRAFLSSLAALGMLACGVRPATAQTLWQPIPVNDDWNTAANWSPANVPNTAGEMAEFRASTIQTLTLSADTTVGGITFGSGSGAFTINPNGHALVITGAGVSNSDPSPQTFDVASGYVYVVAGTAANTNSIFYKAHDSGLIYVQGTATGGSAIFSTSGSSSAVLFAEAANNASAAKYIGGDGTLYVNLDSGVLSLGSIEGSGLIRFFPGAATQTLQVGSLNTDTTFSGSIVDYGAVGTLTKVGTGSLTLTGNNSYSGGTNVNQGTLIIDNDGHFILGTLGTGTTTVNGATAAAVAIGNLQFVTKASAGSGPFIVNAGTTGGAGGEIDFYDTATASSGNFTVNGLAAGPGSIGFLNFNNNSTAGSATLNGKGGNINFNDASTAGTSTIEVFSALGAAGASALNFNFGDVNGTASAGGAKITVDGASGLSGTAGLSFHGKSTAGDSSTVFSTITAMGGMVAGAPGATVDFYDTSSASYAHITLEAGALPDALASTLTFHDGSTAGHATIEANAGISNASTSANITFNETSTAGSANITLDGKDVGTTNSFLNNTAGAYVVFNDTSTAGSSTLIANTGVVSGGGIFFADSSLGGTATVQVTGKGLLDISIHNAGSVAIGSLAGSGQVFLGANELKVGGLNTDTTFSGVIQDGGLAASTGGAFTKEGTGKLTLTGISTYTGATQVNGGTLEFATDGSLYTNGTVAGTITVNDTGRLLLSRTDTFGQANSTLKVLLVVNAGGTVQSNNTYTAFEDATFNGGTLLSAGGDPTGGPLGFEAFGLQGTVAIGGTTATHFSASGTGNVYNAIGIGRGGSPASTTFQVADATGDAAADLIVSVPLGDVGASNSGSLVKTGPGTMQLDTAASTYTGTTTVSSGTLKVTAGGSIIQTAAVGVDGLAANKATLTVDGTGGGSVASAGIIVVGGSDHGTLNVLKGGTVTSNGQSLIGAQTSGNGTVNVDGAGSSWTNTGNLSVGWMGTGALNITNGGQVSSATIYIGDLANSDGTVTVQDGGVINVGGGTGTVTLGQNSGSTGTLNIGNGGAAGTVNASTINGGVGGGVVNFNHSDINLAFAPIISGNVTVNHNGPGSTLFSGAQTYTGNTNINGGTLFVDGSIASPNTFVNPGGTLGGNGFVGGNVTNKGIVSPGHSPGTLTIGGNYTQLSGGTLVIQIASNSSFDKLNIGGHATLGGKLQIVALNGYTPQLADHLVFLTATGGVSGKFSTTDNPFLGSLIRLAVVYEAKDVVLEGRRNSFTNAFGIKKAKKAGVMVPTSVFGITPNQISVALALDSALSDSRQGKVLQFLDSQPFGAVPHHLDRIAPEELTSIYTLGFAQLDAEVLSIQQRLSDIRSGLGNVGMGDASPAAHDSKGVAMDKSGPNVQMPNEDHYGFFLTETGDFASAGDTTNANGFNIKSAGTTLGLDLAVDDHLVLGLTLGYARTDTDLTEDGHMTVDGGRAALYAMYHKGGLYTEGLVGGGYSGYDIKRTALQGSAYSSPNAGELDSYFGTGYDIRMGNAVITPMASVLYSLVGLSSFEESGSLEPLSYPNQNESSLRSRFGIRAATTFRVREAMVTPAFSAQWQHEFLDEKLGFDSSFANGAGAAFTVHGPAIGRDSALLTGSLNISWSKYAAYIAYQADLGRQNYENQTVLVGFRVSW